MQTNYRALETLVVTSGGRAQRHASRLVHRAPDDTRREYLSARGAVERVVADDGRLQWQFVPRRRETIFSRSLRVDQDLWKVRHLDDLLRNYQVSDSDSTPVSGRKVRLLQITPRVKHLGPSKRLWVDVATGKRAWFG